MTPAELRILINVRAAEARRMLGKVNAALLQLEKSGDIAAGSLQRVNGVASSSTVPLRNASAAAASLARALTLMGKGEKGAAGGLTAAALAADKATLSFGKADIAGQHLTVTLWNVGKAGNGAASGLTAASAAAGGFAAAAGKANAGAAAAGAAAGKAAAGAGGAMQVYSGATAGLAANSRNASKSLAQTTSGMNNSATAAQRAGTGFYNLGNLANGANTNLRRNQEITANSTRGQTNFANNLANTSENLRKTGSQAQWAGRQISMMFTAPVALAIGMGTKWILDLQKQQTQLSKVYNDQGKSTEQFTSELNELYGVFRKLSDSYGISQKEITEVGASWAQAGKEGAALANYTKLTAEAMIIGDISSQKAAESMQALSLQWGIGTAKSKSARGEILDMAGAMALTNTASNITQVSYGDLIDAMSRTGATARGVGLTFRETTALLTTLVRVTGSAATAGNGLKSIMSRLLAPTKQAKDAMLELGQATNIAPDEQISNIDKSTAAMQKMGINADDAAWRMKPAAERLKEIAARYADMDAQSQADFAKPFAGLYQIDKFRQIMADLANEQGNYALVMEQTADGADKGSRSFEQYQKELKLFLDSNPQKFKIAGEMIRNSLMDVVIILLPYILKLAQSIAGMAQAFSNMNPVLQKVTIGFLLFLALVGPLAMLIASFKVLFGVMGKGLAKMIGMFIVTKKTTDGSTTSFWRWSAGAKAAGGEATKSGGRIRNGIAAGFNAATTAARKGARDIFTSAKTGAQAATAAWSAGINGIPTATTTMGARNNAAQARNNASFNATTRAGAAGQWAAWDAQGRAIEVEIISWGPAQAAAQRKNMAAQAAAVRSGGVGVVAAQRQVGTAQTAAAATGGGAAGAAAATGVAGGFKRKLGGVLLLFATLGGLIPAALYKGIWNGLKNIGTWFRAQFGRVIQAIRGMVTGQGTKAFGAFFKNFSWLKLLKIGVVTAAIVMLIEAFARGAKNIKDIITKTLGGDGGKIPILARPFILSFRLIGNTLKQLPGVFVDTLKSIVRLVQRAGQAVYKAFSYMNPFAHHSPSLVENVTKGMAVVTDQFSDASGQIQKDMRSSYAAILKFGSATSGLELNTKVGQMQKADTQETIRSADPSGQALGAYNALDASVQRLTAHQEDLTRSIVRQQGVIDGLNATLKQADAAIDAMGDQLDSLQKVADATSDALAKAKDQLEYYANAPIKGMRAMSDAIFENEMAQKRLTLEIMKLEDAGDSVDSVADKFSKLQGEIENLSGQRRDLQLSGAGSDILATYDKMIADLKAQQGDTASGHVAEIDKLNDSLDSLKRKGEMLDLENSLQFDPLTRQIDQMVNSEKELDFATITAGITTYKAQVDSLTIANDAANAAVTAQQAAIDGATAARDALAGRIENEEARLSALNTTYDQVGTAISTAEEAMSNITSSADFMNQKNEEARQALDDAKNAADAAADAVDGLGDSMEDLGEGFEIPPLNAEELETSIDEIADGLTKDIEGMFSGWGDKIEEFFKNLWGKHIWPELKKLGPKISEFIMNLPGELTSAGMYLIGWFAGLAVRIVAGFFVGLYKLGEKTVEAVAGARDAAIAWVRGGGLGRIWDSIGEFFSNPPTIAGALTALAGVGGDLLMGLLNGIGSAFGGIWDWIYEYMVRPLVDGFKEGLGIQSPSTVFAGFGGDIVMGLLNGLVNTIAVVLNWFAGLPGLIFAAIGDLGGMIGQKFSGAMQWIRDRLPEWASAALQWFQDLPGQIGQKLGALWDKISDPFTGAFDRVTTKLTEWKDKIVGIFESLPGAIGSAISTIGDHVKGPVNWVIREVYTGGIRKLWNNTASKIPGIGDMPEMQELAVGGTVAGKAIGGRITGPGTGTSDSIVTTARAGSEIFTAQEVRNAGGFAGLERLLAGKGVSRGNHGGGQQVPVRLSNGEYRLDPSQVAALGGTAAVREIRGSLAAGQMAGHFPGGDIIGNIVDVASDPLGAIGDAAGAVIDTGRSALASAFDKAMGLLGETIPESLTPPGGMLGKLPKGFFNSTRSGLVGAIRGDSATPAKRHGGIIPGFRRGGTVPGFATGGGVPASATAPAVAGSGAPGDGSGLPEKVTEQTLAAQEVWNTYYTTVETAQTTHQATSMAAMTAYQSAEMTALTTHLTAMETAYQTSATNTGTINATLIATLQAQGAAYRTTELAAAGSFYSSMLSSQSTFTNSFAANWKTMADALAVTTTGMHESTVNTFTAMSNDLNALVTGPITDTMNTFDPLLRAVVGWFDTAATDIGTMWTRVEPAVADPSRFVINEVYDKGIRGAWSKVHTWLDLPELDSFVAGFASGGAPGMVNVNDLSNPNTPRNVKNGGPLRAASGSRDSTLFAGMRGEYVLNKDQVKQWGGIGQLENWRKNALKGTKPMEGGGMFSVPGFASGGALKPMGDQDVVPGVIQEVPKVLGKWKGSTYEYGGGGTPGYDCSGWTGAVHKVLLGQSPIGRIWTTEVNHASYGYKRGKDGYWSMGVHNGGGGMNSHTAGTLAGVNYESGGSHSTSTWGGPAAGTVHPQFENQYYLPELGGKFVGNAGGGSYEPMSPMLLKMWDDHLAPFKDSAGAFPGGGLAGQYPEKGFDKFNLLRGVIESKAKEKDEAAQTAMAAAMSAAGSAGDGVERWRPVVHEVLQALGHPLSKDEITLRRMMQESSGNPGAINLDDSNAAKGTPSKGLMQVIDPTFQDYRDPRYPNDIWNPHANIAASMRYAMATYGSLEAAYGRAGGYDRGGWMEPGAGLHFNGTKKPEAVLTNGDWRAIYKAANNPMTPDMIKEGTVDAFSKMFGYQPQNQIEASTQQAVAVALEGQNKTWAPALLGDTNEITEATKATATAAAGTTKAVGILDDNMKTQMANLAEVMSSISTAAASYSEETGVTFGMVAPVLNSLAKFIEGLPKAEASYVPWAGTNQVVTDEMAQEKKLNDIKNIGKGLYNATIKMTPILLKHTATIGTAIEQLVQQDAAAWATGIAALTSGNPMGALILVPVILKEILTVIPLIISAIMDIVPALIETFTMFFTQFMPDSVYAYDTYDAANEAANKNAMAIRQGASAPYFAIPSKGNSVQQSSNETVVYNTFTGDLVMPNVTNETGAKKLADNLNQLAGE